MSTPSKMTLALLVKMSFWQRRTEDLKKMSQERSLFKHHDGQVGKRIKWHVLTTLAPYRFSTMMPSLFRPSQNNAKITIFCRYGDLRHIMVSHSKTVNFTFSPLLSQPRDRTDGSYSPWGKDSPQTSREMPVCKRPW